MRIGIHVQGFKAGKPVAAANALERGAETLQIFASSPRQWRLPPVRVEADRQLRSDLKKNDIRPLFLHAPYLVNLASPTRATRELSKRTVAWTLARAAALGAKGVVVHAGQSVSAPRVKGLKSQVRAIASLLADRPEGTAFLLELTAGGSGAIASTLEHAEEVLDACDGHPRLGLCLDTCHLHAAGYELSTTEGVGEMVQELESRVGVSRVGLIHANDSRDPRGSRRDRHWHIGEGYIGLSGFSAIIANPKLRKVPLVCETPGKVEEDVKNLSALKRARDSSV